MSDDAGFVLSRAGLKQLALAIKGGVKECEEAETPAEQVMSEFFLMLFT